MSSPSSAGTSSIVTPRHRRRDPAGEARRVEVGDRARAAAAAADVLPEPLAPDAERRHDADAGDDDARLSHRYALYVLEPHRMERRIRLRPARRGVFVELARRCRFGSSRRLVRARRTPWMGWCAGRLSDAFAAESSRLRCTTACSRASAVKARSSRVDSRATLDDPSTCGSPACCSSRSCLLWRPVGGDALPRDSGSAAWPVRFVQLAGVVARLPAPSVRSIRSSWPAFASRRHRGGLQTAGPTARAPSALSRLDARGVRRRSHDRRSPGVRRPDDRVSGHRDAVGGAVARAGVRRDYVDYKRRVRWRIVPYVY